MLSLAHVYNPAKHDILNWFLSEKYDGERATWHDNVMRSRSGRIINVPDSIKKYFPKCKHALDGELFIGRGKFEHTGLFRKKKSSEHEWQNVTFEIFDIIVQNVIFKDRLIMLKKLVVDNKHVHLVEQYICKSLDFMYKMYNTVLNKGGEGLVIKNPNSFYVNGRTFDYLKIKPIDTTIVTIVGYSPGKGKYLGKLGAFICQGKLNNKTFTVNVSGMSDGIRSNYSEFEIGKKISIKFSGLTAYGIPRFPRLEN